MTQEINEFNIAKTADIKGEVFFDERVTIQEGVKIDGSLNPVKIANDSVITQNVSLIATEEKQVRVGAQVNIGHRTLVRGGDIGNFCEIGNGCIIEEGAIIGEFSILGEGTYIPAGTLVYPHSVVVGNPYRKLRNTSSDDFEMIYSLRKNQRCKTRPEFSQIEPQDPPFNITRITGFEEKKPQTGDFKNLGKNVEIVGDVVIGNGASLGDNVKIIGDDHGPVRIGKNVTIASGTVLHMLPERTLQLGDNIIIGENCVIHGCTLGNNVIIEDECIICDDVTIGDNSEIKKGTLIPQRKEIKENSLVSSKPLD